MPEYLAPGVYVEEVSFRPKSIEGVGTSTTAFVGPTRKGPLTETPVLVTSFGEFERIYGGLENLSFSASGDTDPTATNHMAHAVRAFFDNGGSRLYIARTFVPRTDGTGAVSSTGTARSDLVVDSGGVQVRFTARMPGSGLNGRITVTEKTVPVTLATLPKAPLGSLLRIRSTQPQAAVLMGGTPPFRLEDGDQLSLTTSAGPGDIVFDGNAAEVQSDVLADPVTIPADTVLRVTIGGTAQSIPIPSGSITLSDLAAHINTRIRRGYARIEGGDRLVLGTDARGTAASLNVAASPALGFPDERSASGTGNVANLDAVTPEEIDGLLQAAGIPVRATTDPATGRLVLSTTETGESARLQAADTSARNALELPAEEARGRAAQGTLYYVKRSQQPDGWIGGTDRTTPLNTTTPLPAGSVLVLLNLEARDADNNVRLYEDVGLSPLHPRWLGAVLAPAPTRRSEALQNPYAVDIQGDVHPFDLRQGLLGSASTRTIALTGGNDGAEPPESTTVEGAVAYADALRLLEDVEDVAIVAAPGYSALSRYAGIQQALITHAENMKYRIAVLDSPPGVDPQEVREIRGAIDSSYAAYYYPWVMVSNPLARPGNDRIPQEIALPPSGFVTGIYARSDVQRGVWKAPANEVVRGAVRLERDINQAQQQVLNPLGINCLRFFPGRGYRVWGARTASSDPEWKYVNVRRYFIFLEHSIDRSTQWVVFEPNGERLWSNVRATVSAFLYNQWVSGALLGSSPEEAYFVRCDRSTMTQDDLDNGRLICLVGVAVLKPAEFVIFRIGQKTADARE
ncbi:MAG: phage tail sheath subtilisin-like domain-containing protein [Desulfacinum sp.]|nr:phage tail sheath subtilisin-like domain-containing protein [Desulfacinum sp.]MBC7359890.1 phage tail sheath subtilisin-like domain-containing protein [Desulfacinum sp.]